MLSYAFRSMPPDGAAGRHAATVGAVGHESWIYIQCDAVQDLMKKGIMTRARGRISLKGKLRCVGQTDTGRVRDHNEDTIAYDADIGLLVLADGMGGYNAGEVASGIAVKTILNLVRESVDRQDLRAVDRESGMSRPSIILRDAIHRANKIIYQTARTQPNCEGMGTTVVS